LRAVRDERGAVRDFEWVLVNRAAEALIGRDGAELLGRRMQETVPGAETDRLCALYAAVVESGRPLEHEHPCPSADGHPRLLKAHVVRHLDGVIVTFADITDRRVLEKEREIFFELSADLLCIADTEGRFRQLNPAWEATLGWTVAELSAVPYLHFVHPDDIEATKAAAGRLAAGEPVTRFENRYRRRDGSWCPLEWNVVPRPDGLLQGVARDISARQAIMAELAEKEARARAAEELLRDAVESVSEGFALYERDGRLLLLNSRQGEIYPGFPTPDEATGMHHEELLRRNVANRVYDDPVAREDPERFVAERLRYHRMPDGQPALMKLSNGRWVQIRKRPTATGRTVSITTDVTALKRTEQRLVDAIESLSGGFAIWDAQDRLVYCNEPYRTLRQARRGHLLPGVHFADVLMQEIEDGLRPRPADPEAWVREVTALRRAGPEERELALPGNRWVQVARRFTPSGDIVALRTDITDLKRAEQRLSDAIESIHEGLAVWDSGDRLVLCNRSFLGFWEAEVAARIAPGIRFADLLRMSVECGATVVEDNVEDYIARRMEHHRAPGKPWQIAQQDGRWLMVTERRTGEGGVVALYADVTEMKRQERALRHQACTDPLTGVYNRRHFLEMAERELQRAGRFGHPVSAMMIDIDRFKPINDTYGHAIGDEVLQRLADCCRTALREIDIFGRIGGEEFSAVLPETPRNGAVVVAERVRAAVAALRVSVPGNPPIGFTVSIGVADWQPEDSSIEATLARADNALYAAKHAGRNRTEAA
ncbi:MAG: PAS-domain containing protein, partial [Acetobacterales bacterium]